jgi:hypothetical protein
MELFFFFLEILVVSVSKRMCLLLYNQTKSIQTFMDWGFGRWNRVNVCYIYLHDNYIILSVSNLWRQRRRWDGNIHYDLKCSMRTVSLWHRQSQQSFNTLTPFYFLSHSLHVSAPTGHLQVTYTIRYFNGLFLIQRIRYTYAIWCRDFVCCTSVLRLVVLIHVIIWI